MGVFCKIDAFPLGVFSVRNSNLRNLKGNGITLQAHESSEKEVSQLGPVAWELSYTPNLQSNKGNTVVVV